MKISVVTVCFNSGNKLIETVNNILKQTYQNIELVIKDGGSTDGSLEAVRKIDDNRIKIFSEPDEGIYDAMNRAVSLSTGDYVIFMNAGDSFYSGDVCEKVARFGLANEKTIAYGDTYFVQSDSLSKAPSKITGSVCYRNIPCHQAIFYSRDVLNERGFDTSYKIRADFDQFSYAYFKMNTTFAYLGFPVCIYEGGGFSESKERKRQDKEEYKRSVKANIPFGKRFVYRATLILTLHKLRGFLARNPVTAKLYQAIKGKLC